MNIDGDPEMLASASIDQVIAYGPEASSECKMLEAVGVSTSGSGGLQWVPSSENAVVVNKYRMMCAMLKDATRNRGYAQAIEPTRTEGLFMVLERLVDNIHGLTQEKGLSVPLLVHPYCTTRRFGSTRHLKQRSVAVKDVRRH